MYSDLSVVLTTASIDCVSGTRFISTPSGDRYLLLRNTNGHVSPFVETLAVCVQSSCSIWTPKSCERQGASRSVQSGRYKIS